MIAILSIIASLALVCALLAFINFADGTAVSPRQSWIGGMCLTMLAALCIAAAVAVEAHSCT